MDEYHATNVRICSTLLSFIHYLIDVEDSANLPSFGNLECGMGYQAVHAAAQAVMSGVHDCCALAAS